MLRSGLEKDQPTWVLMFLGFFWALLVFLGGGGLIGFFIIYSILALYQ